MKKNHRMLIAVLLLCGILCSCSTSHKGCAGICSNKGKSAGKYMHINKNSKYFKP